MALTIRKYVITSYSIHYTKLYDDPAAMGRAFKKGVEAGREAFLAGLGETRQRAEASSPLTGFLHD